MAIAFGAAGTPLFGAWPDGDINGPVDINPAMPSGIVAGDYLFAMVGGDLMGADPVYPVGWTIIGLPHPYDPGNGAQALAYKVASGGDSSPTITISTGAGGGYFAQVYRYSGVAGIGASAIAEVVDDINYTLSVPAIVTTGDGSRVATFHFSYETFASELQSGWARDYSSAGAGWSTGDITSKDIALSGTSSGAYALINRSSAVAWVVELFVEAPVVGELASAGSSVSAISAALITGVFNGIGSTAVTADGEINISMTISVAVAEEIAAVTAGAAPSIFFEAVDEAVSATTGGTAYTLFVVSINNAVSASSAAPVSAIYAVSADSLASLMAGTQFVIDFTDGWAYNLNTGAAGQYEGFGFNSFALVDGEYYGANESGIYRLGGDSDAGEPIQETITLGVSRLDSSAVKTVPVAYVGAQSAEPMTLTCRVEGEKYSYEFSRETASMAPARVKPGKGLSGVYWQFELTNQNGADMDLDQIEIVTAPKSRKV